MHPSIGPWDVIDIQPTLNVMLGVKYIRWTADRIGFALVQSAEIEQIA
jgi:hypothetical protein